MMGDWHEVYVSLQGFRWIIIVDTRESVWICKGDPFCSDSYPTGFGEVRDQLSADQQAVSPILVDFTWSNVNFRKISYEQRVSIYLYWPTSCRFWKDSLVIEQWIEICSQFHHMFYVEAKTVEELSGGGKSKLNITNTQLLGNDRNHNQI